MKALIISQEPAAGWVSRLREMLHRVGVTVEVADGFLPAQELIKLRAFEAAVTDWRLTDGDWRKLLSETRARGEDMPVLVRLGGPPSVQAWREVRNFGGQGLLIEPLDPYQIKALAAAVRARSARRPPQRQLSLWEETQERSGGEKAAASEEAA